MPGAAKARRMRSIKGGKSGIKRYEAIKKSVGGNKRLAAAISNTMAKGPAARRRMARKAARTRARRRK